MRRAIASAGALPADAAIFAALAATGPKLPGISFRVFVKTAVPLSDATWTDTSFLYATENLGQILSGPPEGLPLTPFVSLPPEHEEYRCAPSPRAHGFPSDVVYCHAPHGTIYRLH